MFRRIVKERRALAAGAASSAVPKSLRLVLTGAAVFLCLGVVASGQQRVAPLPPTTAEGLSYTQTAEPASFQYPTTCARTSSCGVPEPCQPEVTCQPRRPPAPPKRRREVHHVFVEMPEQPAAPSRPPSGRQPALPPGSFVAPPQYGTVVQEQGTLGIRGMRIRLPALTLELPSIEFPSLSRSRRGTRMELEGGTAPYVAGAGHAYGAAGYGAAPQGYAAVQQPAGPQPPSGAPVEPEPPAGQPSDREKELEEQLDKLMCRCEKLERLLQQMPSGPACTPAPRGCGSPSLMEEAPTQPAPCPGDGAARRFPVPLPPTAVTSGRPFGQMQPERNGYGHYQQARALNSPAGGFY